MNSWFDQRSDGWVDFEPICPEVYETENPVVATLLDTSGGVLLEVHERPVRRIGFAPHGER